MLPQPSYDDLLGSRLGATARYLALYVGTAARKRSLWRYIVCVRCPDDLQGLRPQLVVASDGEGVRERRQLLSNDCLVGSNSSLYVKPNTEQRKPTKQRIVIGY